MEPRAAAGAVNFRLLLPTLEFAGLAPESLEVRREGPPWALHLDRGGTVWSDWAGLHNSSVRFFLRSRFGTLRCKQFLYDLGPLSTLDHAALYDHRPEQMRVHPLDASRVAWTGYDYEDRRALTLLAWGTNLELREVDGDHPESWLLDLARSFEPLDDVPLAPLAERSYWSRYPRYDLYLSRLKTYRPPSSLWRWRWPWLAVDHRWQRTPPAEAALGGNGELAPDWRFNSACLFGSGPIPGEVQLFFEPASGLGHAQLCLRQFPRAASPLREPEAGGWPELESHSGFRSFSLTRWTSRSGIHGFLAGRTPDYGPHDALWWHGERGFLLQRSAAVGHDEPAMLRLLALLLAEPVAATAG